MDSQTNVQEVFIILWSLRKGYKGDMYKAKNRRNAQGMQGREELLTWYAVVPIEAYTVMLKER